MKKYIVYILLFIASVSYAQDGGQGLSNFTATAGTAPSWTPASTQAAQYAYNYGAGETWQYTGAAWVKIRTGASIITPGLTLTGTTTGSVLFTGASGVVSELVDVAAGQPFMSGGIGVAPAYAGYTFSGTAAQTYTFPSVTSTLLSTTTAASTYLPLAGGTMTGGIVNSTSINPLTTLAESWIGPSTTAGIYFKGGNVGLGIVSPVVNLHVFQTGAVYPTIKIEGDSPTRGSNLTLENDTNVGFQLISYGSTKSGATAGITSADNSIIYSNQTGGLALVSTAGANSKIMFSLNDFEKVRIDNSGNVGIGTTPDRLLHAESSTALTATTNYPLRLSHITSGVAAAGFGAGMEYELEDGSNVNVVAGTEAVTWQTATTGATSANYSLGLMRAGTPTNVITVLGATGNVGIGTALPTEKFHLVGGQNYTVINDAAWNKPGLKVEVTTQTTGGNAAGIYTVFNHNGTGTVSDVSVFRNDFNVGGGISLFSGDVNTTVNKLNVNSSSANINFTRLVSSLNYFRVDGANYLNGDFAICSENNFVLTNAAAKIKNAYLFYGRISSNAGTIENMYGAYIADLSALGTMTNVPFAFYQAGTSDKNYFAGKVGIGTTGPTAVLHLKAGTATANTAPFKFTAGTNLTTPEAGAMEWDGTTLFVTQTTGPTRKTIAYTTDIPTGTTYLNVNGNTNGAEFDFGTNDAFGSNWEYNNTDGLRLGSTGRLFTGTLTDVILTPSDSVKLFSGLHGGWTVTNEYARLYDSLQVAYQLNLSNGAHTFNVPDNFSTGLVINSTDAKAYMNISTTNGSELLSLGAAADVDVKINGGLQDADGDLGTNIQVLASTVTGTNWINATGNKWVPSGTISTDTLLTVDTFKYVLVGTTLSFSGRVNVAYANGSIGHNVEFTMPSGITTNLLDVWDCTGTVSILKSDVVNVTNYWGGRIVRCNPANDKIQVYNEAFWDTPYPTYPHNRVNLTISGQCEIK